jgi:hypothetical protein
MKPLDVVSMLMVGAFWGCTNPWIRRGALETALNKTMAAAETKHSRSDKDTTQSSALPRPPRLSSLASAVRKFQDYRVWLPYALNQAGSGVYYVLLSSSDLTMAVPICNGLALVFSCITSRMLGERVDKPGRAILGAALVMVGTGLCIVAQDDHKGENDATRKE